jgi:hypothetical protein
VLNIAMTSLLLLLLISWQAAFLAVGLSQGGVL